jgi:hypothetical protein
VLEMRPGDRIAAVRKIIDLVDGSC